MTTVPSADRRPPHLHPPEPDASTSAPVQSQARSVATGLLDVDDRASKRRKVDGSGPSQDDITGPNGSNGAPQPPKYTNPGDLRLLAAIITPREPVDATRTDPKETALPLMPVHPWKDRIQKRFIRERKPTLRPRPSRGVPCTPDALVTPDVGPVLVNDRPAGYFPWGARPSAEDHLSDINVKNGYQDRPPNPPEKELNTARVPLYQAFRQHSGLDSLSTIFSIILEAKSKHNMLDSISAFKPPPRVTLSEPKKKTWIGELADPNVPLRKLSRTIPQGIRGMGLLEQCLQNTVPLSRAIWFVKCVGANEIRTLKRKGTSQAVAAGGERAWLKEWTINIEQHVESILNQNGQPLWKQNLQYNLRLTTRLYLENLLDRDHFLDWIIDTLAATSHERIPFWLMMAHVFKQDLAKFRKRGRRLAEIITQRFIALKDSRNAVVQTIVLKLRESIRGFAIHRPQLFLAPDSWPSLKPVLQSCLHVDNALESRLLQRLEVVNERCMGASKQHYHAKPDPRDTMVDMLDAATVPFDLDELSRNLFSLSSDYSVLVPAVAEWATSRYRLGAERVHIASRLLKKWQKNGLRIDGAILEFVGRCHGSPELFNADALRHLAAELSRSRAFPTSKYMQWLSVRGLPWPKSVRIATQVDQRTGETYTRQSCKDSSLLLPDILFSEADSRHLNLRNSLLSRAGFDTELESRNTQRLQTLIRGVFQNLCEDKAPSHSAQELTALLKDWNWRVRSALAHGLRSFVVAKVKQQALLRHQGAPELRLAISLHQFKLVRTCVEALSDEAVLADIVRLCSQTYEEEIQAALVQTVHRHARVFSAIGALEPLQTLLSQNYMSLRGVKVTMPLFATALLDLQTAYPCKKIGGTKMFHLDLIRGDRSRAVAACSPFSDGVADALQNAEATFIEDFEAVLQSEPSMNEQTMSGLFALLTERIEKQTNPAEHDLLFTYCQLLARLKLCRRAQCDQLIGSWLVKLLSMNPVGFAQTLVSCLIEVGALTVHGLINAFAGHKMAAQILQHMLPDQLAVQHYSVNSKWIEFAERNPHQLLNLLSQVPRGGAFDMDDLFSRVVLQSGEDLKKPAQGQLCKFLDKLIGKGPGGDVSASLESMDVFSLPFVRLHLQLSTTNVPSDSGLADAIVNAAAKGSADNIAKLLHAAQSDLASQVRQLLDDNIMEMLPVASQGKLLDVSLDLERMERLQAGVDQAFLLFPSNSTTSAKNTSQIVEKLQQFLKFLGSSTGAAQAASPSAFHKQAAVSPATPNLSTPNPGSHLFPPSSPMDTSTRSLPSTIIDYFRIMLQLLCLQRPVHPADKDLTGKPQSHPEHVKILAYVAHIATHAAFMLPALTFPESPQLQQRARETVEFAYDVMATYVDDLTDDNRATCAKILKDRLNPVIGANVVGSVPENLSTSLAAMRENQARLKWLFGSVNAMGSDLPNAVEMGSGLLVTKRSADGKPVTTSTGTNLGSLGLPSTATSAPTSVTAAGLTMDWKPRIWEVLECHGRPDGETSLGLGLFGARRPLPVQAVR